MQGYYARPPIHRQPNKRLQLTSGRRDVLEAGTFLASKAQAWPARVAPTWAAEP